MDGNDMFSGAHFDEYIADYEYVRPGPIDPGVFKVPELCAGQPVQKRTRPPSFPLRMASLLPSVRIGRRGNRCSTEDLDEGERTQPE
jgi:hypothetical protein